MIVRMWKTSFDVTQKSKLATYANNVSLPVLSSRPGCHGVIFCSDHDSWITMTLWEDQASIDALDDDPEYEKIVDGILALDILGDHQETNIYAYEGGAIKAFFESSV